MGGGISFSEALVIKFADNVALLSNLVKRPCFKVILSGDRAEDILQVIRNFFIQVLRYIFRYSYQVGISSYDHTRSVCINL